MAEWILILAAGESKRFNGVKALAPWGNGTFLSHAVHTARLTGSSIMVVTGAHQAAIAPVLTDVHVVWNADWMDGMGRSLSVGVQAIQDRDPAPSVITILPVDQPFVTTDHLNALAVAARQSGQCVLTRDHETVGPPAAIPQPYFKAILELRGDKGLKSVLRADDYQTIANPAALRDIDTQADLQRYDTRQQRP